MIPFRREPDEASMDRCSDSQFVHFFDSETRRLSCGFVDAHIGWAIHAEQVDCPACRGILSRGAAAVPDAGTATVPDAALVPPRDSREHIARAGY